MFDWIVVLVERGGYVGIALLMLTENLFLLIPSELIMPLAGFSAAQGKSNVVLLVLTVYILYEAYRRFVDPPEILGWPMLLVAAGGLAVNLVSMRLLAGGSSESLNVQGAHFEVLSDMLGSRGVILAALVIMWTGWQLADLLIGAGIGLFIVPRTWSLLRQAVHILLEGTPPRVDLDLMERRRHPRRYSGARPACVDHHLRLGCHERARRRAGCGRERARAARRAGPSQGAIRDRSRHGIG